MAGLLHSCVWLIGSLGIAYAVYGEMFQKCIRYKDKVPEVSGAIKVCVKGWDDATYCRFFNNPCPDIQECNNNIAPTPRDNHCMLCPDVGCVYNGNIFQVGEVFDSVDGVNQCQCFRGGQYKCDDKNVGRPISFCT